MAVNDQSNGASQQSPPPQQQQSPPPKEKKKAAEAEKKLIRRRFAVALNSPADHNTVRLEGLDLIIPLEKDLDKDPEVADEIRLKSEGAGYESHVTSDDPDVEPDGDNPLNLYPFRDVPPGIYSISVKVGDHWRDVLTGFRVTRDGVFFGSKSIERTANGSILGSPVEEPEQIEEEQPEPEYGDYVCEA